MELKKNLDLSITLRDEEFSVNITEPESGEVISMTHYYAFDEHPSFNEDIGNEIYSWLSLWKDEQEESCGANATTTPDGAVADHSEAVIQAVIDLLIDHQQSSHDWELIKENVDRAISYRPIQ